MKKKVVKKTTLDDYSDLMVHEIKDLDYLNLNKIINSIWSAYIDGRRMYFAGNGGSASLASHMAADLGKNTTKDHKNGFENRLNTISLCDNVAWISAISNDMSYDDIFVEQLKSHATKPGDVLIIISGSGNSTNIIKAAVWAREHQLYLIGILGFDGGFVKNLLDLSLIVKSANYGIVESMHSFIHHYIVEYIKMRKREE